MNLRLFWFPWAFLFLLFMGWYHGETVPKPFPDAPAGDDGRHLLPCLSYSPYYRPGITPYRETTHIPSDWIDADLAALARITRCIRTYSVDQGLDAVAPLAARHGLTLWLGVWIGRDERKNRIEFEKALTLARAYPQTVTRLIVGNEVLLRREQTPEQLAAWLAEARARSPVPVTYADVWEFWLRYRHHLLPHVDVATIHILPYWEDRPQPVEEAAQHLFRVRTMVRQLLGSIPIAIGETGWPSAGKQRQGAVPSRVHQARYLRELLSLAQTFGWEVNIIESHDQPWKRAAEGTVGGYWGIFDVSNRPKFSLTGPLAERQTFLPPLLFAVTGAIALSLAGTLLRRRHFSFSSPLPEGSFFSAPLLALLGALLALSLFAQWEHALIAYRTPLETLVLSSVGLIAVFLALSLALVPSWRFAPPIFLRRAMQLLIFALAVANLWLTIDGRYRDFAFQLYLPFALVAPLRRWPVTFPERVWAGVAIPSALFLWLSEMQNGQAFVWCVVTLAILLPLPRLSFPYLPDRSRTNSFSSDDGCSSCNHSGNTANPAMTPGVAP